MSGESEKNAVNVAIRREAWVEGLCTGDDVPSGICLIGIPPASPQSLFPPHAASTQRLGGPVFQAPSVLSADNKQPNSRAGVTRV